MILYHLCFMTDPAEIVCISKWIRHYFIPMENNPKYFYITIN